MDTTILTAILLAYRFQQPPTGDSPSNLIPTALVLSAAATYTGAFIASIRTIFLPPSTDTRLLLVNKRNAATISRNKSYPALSRPPRHTNPDQPGFRVRYCPKVGRAINTAGTYRESHQTPGTKSFTRPMPPGTNPPGAHSLASPITRETTLQNKTTEEKSMTEWIVEGPRARARYR